MNEQAVSAGPAEGPGILAVFMIEDKDAHEGAGGSFRPDKAERARSKFTEIQTPWTAPSGGGRHLSKKLSKPCFRSGIAVGSLLFAPDQPQKGTFRLLVHWLSSGGTGKPAVAFESRTE